MDSNTNNQNAGALNTKAASRTAMESSTAKKPGRPRKELGPSQKQKIMDFFHAKPKPEKRGRRDRDYDSSDEDMEEGDCKAARLAKSPTQQEMEVYKEVAKDLHKKGQLRPAIAKRS